MGVWILEVPSGGPKIQLHDYDHSVRTPAVAISDAGAANRGLKSYPHILETGRDTTKTTRAEKNIVVDQSKRIVHISIYAK